MSAEPASVRVAAVQFAPKLGDLSHNRAEMLGRLQQAARARAHLVVFPECALSGYALDSRAEGLECAEPVPGPSVGAIAEACADLGVAAAFGLLEREGEALFNTCALVGPGGLVGRYRKVHLPFMGVDRFADPGQEPFRVHEAMGLRLGLHICYDGTFPEVGRILALEGADLLVLPTNWPAGAEAVAEYTMASRAIENTIYSVAVNRVGEERGVRFVGRSSIWGPHGESLARASDSGEEILFAEIDPTRARKKRIVRVPGRVELDRVADRRPDFYGRLIEPR